MLRQACWLTKVDSCQRSTAVVQLCLLAHVLQHPEQQLHGGCGLAVHYSPDITAATLNSFRAVTFSPSTRALASSVNMLLVELRMVLLVTLVSARDTVNMY